MIHFSIRFMAMAMFGIAANAQGIYANSNSPKDSVCPRILRDKTELNYGSGAPPKSLQANDGNVDSPLTNLESLGGRTGADTASLLSYGQGQLYFPSGQRKDVAAFAAYDAKGKATSLASLKGKVVLVGLWSVRCDPSAKMLNELATLYPKRDQHGFEILAVNFDENQQDGGGIEGGWRAIRTFSTRNKQFFEASKMPVYVPGLGKEGASNFMDNVHSLPALFVIDREGRLSQLHIGYKDGFVGEAISRALRERPLAQAPQAAQPIQPAQPVQPARP